MSDDPIRDAAETAAASACPLPTIHMGPRVWSMEMRELRRAEKEGRAYAPVTDRMRSALEEGRAPEPFAAAFRKTLS